MGHPERYCEHCGMAHTDAPVPAWPLRLVRRFVYSLTYRSHAWACWAGIACAVKYLAGA